MRNLPDDVAEESDTLDSTEKLLSLMIDDVLETALPNEVMVGTTGRDSLD